MEESLGARAQRQGRRASDIVYLHDSCSKIFVMTLGYITIPLMSFTAFALILLLQIMQKKMEK